MNIFTAYEKSSMFEFIAVIKTVGKKYPDDKYDCTAFNFSITERQILVCLANLRMYDNPVIWSWWFPLICSQLSNYS